MANVIESLSKALRERKIGAVELTREYLSRIAERNPAVNAYITVCDKTAIDEAEEAQRLIDAGDGGPLTGVPLAIKDNICTEGIRTTCASRMLENFVPPYSATVARRLRAAGAVTLGKANMDEFAMGGSSQTSYFGGVKNPVDLTRVPGGSSGGSAAAVAAGLAAGALGSDTGGSIRQPAAFCGVVGLKPTYGAVSRYGLVAFASSLDQIGPIAGGARDCAVLFDVIAGGDPNDGTCRPGPAESASGKMGMSLSGVTVGLPREFFGEGVDDEVKSAVLKAAEALRNMGCELKEVSLPGLRYAISAYFLISSAEAASNLARFDGIKYGYRSKAGETYEEQLMNTRREGFGSEVKRRIMLGNYALSSGYYDAYYNKAVKVRSAIKREYAEIFSSCDCVLTPTTPTAAYRIGEKENDPVKMYVGDICTVTANIAGLPAVSVPCGTTGERLPVGMQIIGRAYDEATILAVADAYEREGASRG